MIYACNPGIRVAETGMEGAKSFLIGQVIWICKLQE